MADISLLPQYHSLYRLHHTDMLLPRMLSCIVEICTCLKCRTAPGREKVHLSCQGMDMGAEGTNVKSAKHPSTCFTSQALNKEAT